MTQKNETESKRPKGYWTPKGIDAELFELNEERLPRRQRKKALQQLKDYTKKAKESFLGYQATQKMDFKDFADYLNVSINNIGNSFSNSEWGGVTPPDGYFRVNAKWVERAVLDYYAKLWNAQTPHLAKDEAEGWEDSYWGYVLSMGSTEGNLLGLRSGRDYLNGTRLQYDEKGAKEVTGKSVGEYNNPAGIPLRFLNYQHPKTKDNSLTPILFYSEATHYSVKKIAEILQLKIFGDIGNHKYPNDCPIEHGEKDPWPSTVPINKATGTIDEDKFIKLATFFIEKGYPIIVNFNYGTTWTGGYDNVGNIINKLIPILKEHGMYEREIKIPEKEPVIRNGFWFHVDGALGASYAPFLKMEEHDTKIFPDFDFKLEIHSLVTSSHKWMGLPWPCGVYMSKNKFLVGAQLPAYVGSMDSTLAGSRNGLSPILIWDYLSQHSYEEQKEEVLRKLNIAEYAKIRLAELYEENTVHRVEGTLAIRFPEPSGKLIKKYGLPRYNKKVHLLIMRHVTKELIDELIHDLKKEQKKPKELKVVNEETYFTPVW